MRRAVVLALALWGILAATASAQVVDDDPAAASRAYNDARLFARAADGTILQRSYTVDGWTPWTSLGGSTSSGVSAVAQGRTIRIFARGTDNAIWERVLDDTTWGPWTSLGGVATSAPAATLRKGPENVIDLSVRGGDGQLFHQSLVPGRGWSGWAPIGGPAGSAPALNSQADGLLNIFVRGTDCAMWQKSWTGTAWTDWIRLDGCLTAAPTVVSRAVNQIDVYGRGTGGETFQKHWDLNGWTGWFLLDNTPIGSAAGVVSDHDQREMLFARGASGLMTKVWNGSIGWSGWMDLGPVSIPPLPTPQPPTQVPLPDGNAELETGVRCTPPGGRLRVSIKVRTAKGKKKARVSRILFFTKGKGRAVRSDRKAPFVVRIKINRPAGATGRVYARVYYRRSAKGKLHRKTVSRRYTVCR
jgi:hypothetical protein